MKIITASGERPRVLPWRGDAPQACHGQFPPLQGKKGGVIWPDRVEIQVEVAVVGAGLSGLTAAYHLRDRQLVVLEAGSQPGGVCLPGSYRGQPYPAGSAYFYLPEDPQSLSWYQELGLNPEKARVSPPASALYQGGDWYPDCFSAQGLVSLPFPPRVKEELQRFAGELAELEETWEPLGSEVLSHPELDQLSLKQYLEEKRGFPPELTHYFDPYCRSCLGAGAEDVSAWAALYFLMSEFSPASRTAAFPEGNARLVRALAEALPRSVLVQHTVVDLKNTPGGPHLLVWDAKGRRHFRLAAAVVILAVGKFVVRRLLGPDCGFDLKAFQAFRYSSYVVAALCGPLTLEAPGFENWVAGEPAFSDFILSPRAGSPGGPRVMVLFAPQPYPKGRGRLLARSPGDQARELLEAVARHFPGLPAEVEEIHLYRFGHAQVVPYPGFLSLLKSRVKSRKGRIILAAADLEGLPCVEAAIIQGEKAAGQAREILGI
uniref:Amine oxidase domain-containing protein n=1 Tax=Desulfobacca acetoxidans TaxID=60893 RepID=A0A7C5AMP5_9BACT